MSYDTHFDGKFLLDRPLTAEHQAVLRGLAGVEHVPGEDGKPAGVLCRYCEWQPSRDGTAIVCDNGEGFACWLEWLRYLIDRHLGPWGYSLNGEVRWSGGGDVEWEGELIPDRGVIYARDNRVEAVPDRNPGPSWDRRWVPVRIAGS